MTFRFHPSPVCAGIITFNPDPDTLGQLVETLSRHSGKIVVIDNGSRNRRDVHRLAAGNPAVELISNRANRGVAAAVNQLAERARADGYRYILPFDQDSLPVEGIRSELVRLFEEAQAAGKRPAAVGPVRVDPQSGEREAFIRFRMPLNERIDGSLGVQAVDCDFLITSGCLISLEALEAIGMMEAELFVDNVDLEWSFRAKSKGYCLLGALQVPMQHRIGDASVKLPWLRTAVRFHAPVRTYYVVRNRLRLYRRSYVPAAWKIQDLLRFVPKMVLLFTVSPQRNAHFRYFKQGLRDS